MKLIDYSIIRIGGIRKNMNNTKTNKIYYEPQKGWSKEDFFYLHRVLHRTLYYYEFL